MNLQQTQSVYHQFGTLLCLDAPKDGQLLFGIDSNSWQTGDRFQGIKMIPIGLHYIFFRYAGSLITVCLNSIQSKYGGDFAPRTSIWLNFQQGDVKVLRWDSEQETFIFLAREDSTAYLEGVQRFQFDSGLGPYPVERLEQWTSLTSFVSLPLVLKLQPIGQFIITTGKSLTTEEKRQIDEALEDLGIGEAGRDEELSHLQSESQCYFSRIPRITSSKNLTPAEITALNMDKSKLMAQMVEREYQNQAAMFIGELQFSFVCFLLGQSYEAFEQWKSLIIFSLNCESALKVSSMESFWIALLQVIRVQLLESPDDFFIDIVEGTNFLHHTLSEFFEIVNDDHVPEKLKNEAASLMEFAEDKFGIPFDVDMSARSL